MKFFFKIFTIVFIFSLYNTIQAGIIRGRITDNDNGEPLEGVSVSAINEILAVTFDTESDANGLFELNLPNGYYKLRIELDGYIPSAGFSFFIQESTVFEDLSFELRKVLKPDNIYAGVVIDSQTQMPIHDAFVLLYSGEHTIGMTTDSEGKFSLENIKPGEYYVGVTADDYEGMLVENEITVIEDSTKITDVQFSLTPQIGYSVSLSGTVYGENSTGTFPMATAPVYILAYSLFTGDSLYYETVTNAQGEFSISNIQPALYNAHAIVEGFMGNPKYNIPLFIDKEVDFYLKQIPPKTNSYISGRVWFQNFGDPIGSAEITFYGDDGSVVTTNTDFGGFYSQELEPGNYKVSATVFSDSTHGNYSEDTIFYDGASTIEEAATIELELGETVTEINFQFDRPTPYKQITINGKIEDENGEPLTDAAVYVHKFSTRYLTNPIVDRTFTDQEGNYSISLMIFGRKINFAVQASKQGYATQFYGGGTSIENADFFTLSNDTLYFKESFTIVEDDQISGIYFILDEGEATVGTIKGTVTNVEGEGIARAYVIATNLITEVPYSTVVDTVIGAAGGMYELNNLPNGEYVVLFLAEGYAPEYYDNAVGLNNATIIKINGNTVEANASLSVIPQSPGNGWVDGKIYANNNRILSGTLVRLYNSEYALIDFSVANNNGSYLLKHVNFEDMIVTVSKPGYLEIEADTRFQPANDNTMELNFSMEQTVLSVDDKTDRLPEAYNLGNNYPNPFNPTTNITFSIPLPGLVKLKVYNILGQEIRSLVNKNFPAGSHSVTWDGKDNSGNHVASGLYFYSLEAGPYRNAKKMVLLR